MNRFQVEMFWMPSETVAWLRWLANEYDLWFAVWPVGFDTQLIEVAKFSPENFCSNSEDSIQIFIGHANISGKPHWRSIADKRILDFSKSYAVQFVPSILMPDRGILLQGRLTIFDPDQYGDIHRGQELVEFFRALKSSMIKYSDRKRVIVQTLTTGKKKQWRNILVGKAIEKNGSFQFKQFENGAVEFDVEKL